MDKLTQKLAAVRNIFPEELILNRTSDDIKSIAKYYKLNRLTYDLLHSSKGFVHMAISRNGIFNSNDFYEQGKIIEDYIHQFNAKQILELAPGKAVTTLHLAKRNPDSQFYGIDLANGQMSLSKNSHLPNLHLRFGDFHDLSMYRDGSMDIVYIIEALCYARDRFKVLSEIRRLLKPGGHLIIFDGYFDKKPGIMSEEERKTVFLIAKSMMVSTENNYYPDLAKELHELNFKVLKEEDLSQAIMPNLLRLENKAKRLIEHPRLAKALRVYMSDLVLGNAIAGYLMADALPLGLLTYRLNIVKNQTQ